MDWEILSQKGSSPRKRICEPTFDISLSKHSSHLV
jgi:hypothetical protein